MAAYRRPRYLVDDPIVIGRPGRDLNPGGGLSTGTLSTGTTVATPTRRGAPNFFAGPQVIAGDPAAAANATRQAATLPSATGTKFQGYGKTTAQAVAPAAEQPANVVGPSGATYNGQRLAPGSRVGGATPYSGGVSFAGENLPDNAPSYTGGGGSQPYDVNNPNGPAGKFIGADERDRIARVGAEKASLATPDAQVTNPLSYADQSAEIKRLYPEVGKAGTPQNALFVKAFNEGGGKQDGVLDLAHSLFKPQTPEQIAAQGADKRAAQSSIQTEAADLRRTPGERAALATKATENQAKIAAAGKTVYDPDATLTNIARGVGDAFSANTQDLENYYRPVAGAVGSFFRGFGGSPNATPPVAASPATLKPAPVAVPEVNPPGALGTTAPATPAPLPANEFATPRPLTLAANNADPNDPRKRRPGVYSGF